MDEYLSSTDAIFFLALSKVSDFAIYPFWLDTYPYYSIKRIGKCNFIGNSILLVQGR